MKTGVRLFISSAVFGAVISTVYWFSSYDLTGTILLGMLSAAMVFGAGYAYFAERGAGLVGDDAQMNAGAGKSEKLGVFTTRSAWPIISAVAFALLLFGILLALGGCSHAVTTSSVVRVTPTETYADATRGAHLFAANCAACHGATGREGGMGPPLVGEARRMTLAQAIAWIENPQPPMPKLYPHPLRASDVADVAAYVRSL